MEQNTQMPWLDCLWRDNPLIPVSAKRNPLVEFGAARIRERMNLIESGKGDLDQKDFLSSFIAENAKDRTLPAMYDPTYSSSNLGFGNDAARLTQHAIGSFPPGSIPISWQVQTRQAFCLAPCYTISSKTLPHSQSFKRRSTMPPPRGDSPNSRLGKNLRLLLTLTPA